MYYKLVQDFDTHGEIIDVVSTPEMIRVMQALRRPGQMHGVPAIHLEMRKPGPLLDYNVDNLRGHPVVSRRLASLLTQWVPDAVQFIPALLEGSKDRMVLRVTRHLKCLDRDRTKFYVNGQGKTEVATPAIDPARAAGNHIFRVQEDPRAFDVIVSHWLREKFEQSKVTGAYFTPLPGDYDSVR